MIKSVINSSIYLELGSVRTDGALWYGDAAGTAYISEASIKSKRASVVSTKTIYFDESGNTGPNLLDPQQKFFSIGSTDLTELESHTILQKHFPRHIGTDIKFKKLFRDEANHGDLIQFAHTVGQQPERFFSYLMDKKFALLCRLIDWLVEPLFHEQGYDWYKDDYGRSWANICYLGFRILGDNETLLTEVTGLYSELVREPSPLKLEKMQRRFREIANDGLPSVSRFMDLIAAGADEIERNYSLGDLKGQTDIHVASLVSSVGWWRSQHDEDFEIIHDESTYFFKRQGIWDMITSSAASSAVVYVGRKSIQFPLRVRSTAEGASEKLASLQVCDLIGGFVARSRSDTLSIGQQSIIDAMVKAGFGEIGFDSVEPGDFYAQGLPPLADGPDAVDQITMAVRPRTS